MKIAVTCENNQVFQHFGHTPEFALFQIEEGKIIAEKIISSGEEGHGALASLLANEAVDVLIGGGALNALSQAGIQVIGGAEGNVKEVVEALLAGTLQVRQNFHCNHHHHGEGHSCGGHTCGHGSCGH